MLAVLWGSKEMVEYIQGLPKVITETDHKPMAPIINNKLLHNMSPRIQRLRTRLMKFEVHAVHIKGKELPDADGLSRAPDEHQTTTE